MCNSGKSGKKTISEAKQPRARKAKLQPLRPDTKQTLRKTGIDILGDAPWGTHFCQFYQTKEDLIDILVPYFKTGLENNEFCMWFTSEPLSSEDAKRSLKQAVKNLDGYIKKGQIEILDYSQWYTKLGKFEADKVLQGWVEKHNQALKRGFDGLRLTGNTFWLEKKDWTRFAEYEAVINETIGKYKMLSICTYSLERCGASEILDVEHNHQFSLIRWKGGWKILESSDSNQLEARLAEQTMIAEVLERSRKEWESTFNAISDWVAITDLNGRILRINRAGEKFTGAPLAEIVGQSCCKLVHGSEKHIPGCPLRKMLKTGQHETKELQVPDTNHWVMVTVDPVTDEQGKIIGAVHITRDITERKKAEAEIKRTKELFEKTFLSLDSAVFILDAKSPPIIVDCNPAATKIFAYEKQEMLGRMTEFLHVSKEALLEFQSALYPAIEQQGCLVDFEFRMKKKNGQVFATEHSVYPLKDDTGKRIGWVSVVRDITERKKAEEAYRSLVDHSLQGLAIFQDGRVVFTNQAMAEITGYTEDEMLAMSSEQVQAFVHPDDRELVWNRHRDRLNGEELPERYEFRGIRKDESICWLEIHASRIEFQGRPAIQAAYVDITERKKAEEALRKSEEHYRMLAETMNDGLGQLDENGTYVYVNNKLGEMLGYSPDEMIGRHWTAFFDEDAQKIISEQLVEGRKGVAKPYEIINTRRAGQRIFIRISPQAIFDKDGKFRGSVAIFTDITERKKAQEVIERLARFPAESPSPVLRISAHGTVIYGNKASLPLLKVWGCRVGRSIPDQWYEFVLDGLSSGETRQTEVECDGRTFSLTFAPVIKANYVNVYGLDITERKKAENKLHDYQTELKSLASELTLAEERERRRIATELHDRIGQSLIISKLGLDTARDSESSADLAKALNEATKEIEQIIQEVRSLTFELSSPILYELGFETAVADWLTERIRKKHGIATEFEDDGQPKGLDDDTRAVLFRDVRELLTNVVKHAQAKSVKVSIRKVGSQIYVSVEDDGCGFDPAEIAATATKAGGFGLFSIRERLKQLKGNIEIQSAPGRGTRITLTVPLKQ